MAHRPSTKASYTIGSGTTMQENQLAAQIAAEHNIFPQMALFMSWIFLVLMGIDPGVSLLGGEIVSHNTTDTRQYATILLYLFIPSRFSSVLILNIKTSHATLVSTSGIFRISKRGPNFLWPLNAFTKGWPNHIFLFFPMAKTDIPG